MAGKISISITDEHAALLFNCKRVAFRPQINCPPRSA